MRLNPRTFTGALLMLGILPIFAGLLACMPEYVPLGDPEKSRIDPELNGYWFIPGDDSAFGGVLVLGGTHTDW